MPQVKNLLIFTTFSPALSMGRADAGAGGDFLFEDQCEGINSGQVSTGSAPHIDERTLFRVTISSGCVDRVVLHFVNYTINLCAESRRIYLGQRFRLTLGFVLAAALAAHPDGRKFSRSIP